MTGPAYIPIRLVADLGRAFARAGFPLRRRLRLAWLLATNSLTRDDAQNLTLQLRYLAGWHPLSTLCFEDVMDELRKRYSNADDVADIVETSIIVWAGRDAMSAFETVLDCAAEVEHDAALVGITLIPHA